jgi:hypothetical protein
MYHDARGITRMQKPAKIFLENTNIPYAMGSKHPDPDNVNQTFLANQLSFRHKLTVNDEAGIIIDNGIIISTAPNYSKGKNVPPDKSGNRYLASGDLEYGNGNVIPLWMFGFIY